MTEQFSFEATKEDGSPRVFVGMWRSPSVPQAQGYVLCTCGSMLQTVQMMKDHWLQGHFDRPLYSDSPAIPLVPGKE